VQHNSLPRIPRPCVAGGQYFFTEAEADAFVRARAGLPPAPLDKNAPTRLIKLSTLAERLDVHPKSVKRWLRQAYGAACDAEVVEALARRESFGPKRKRALETEAG